MDIQTVTTTAAQVLVMFLLMAVGFVAFKIKLLDENACARMNRFLMCVVTPAILVRSFNKEFSYELLEQLGFCLGIFALAQLMALACALIFVRGKDEKARTERFSVCFSNNGFMGIPLIAAVLGDDAVVFASCGVAVFSLGCWSYGRAILAGGFGDAKTALKKIFLSPGILGTIAGVILFFLPTTLGGPVEQAISFVADLNTPLAMILVGTFVAQTNILGALKNFGTWRVSVLRLLIVPAISMVLYLIIPAPKDPATAAFIMTCCPVGASAGMMPNMLGLNDGAKWGSAFVSVSTLLSIITIPVMMLVGQLVI